MSNGRSRLHLKSFGIGGVGLAFLAALAGCSSSPSDPSEDSKFLQGKIVPRIMAWAKGRGETLPLSTLVSGRGFDWICVVPEYSSIKSIEETTHEIDEYHGRKGYQVPETHLAIIAVEGPVAHVAYLNYKSISVYTHHGVCKSARKSILKRIEGTLRYSEEAVLEEFK